MKKIFILIGIFFVLFFGFILSDIIKKGNKVPILSIENTKIDVNKIYVYGTHLNMEGIYNIDDSSELVLYNGDFISYSINIDNDKFNLSSLINDGIYLDDIPIGNYFLFFRVKYTDNDVEKYKYYALNNITDYDETIYYSMSKFNKKITIFNEESYPTMMMMVENSDRDDVYDIVIDPGHGGRDGGASKYGYKETDFTMNLALNLKNRLVKEGFKVKLTHEKNMLSSNDKLDEYGVHGRAVIPREVDAKYLFSLHLNSSNDSNVSGLEIYTAKNIDYSLAKSLVNNLTSLTKLGISNNKINRIYDGIYSRTFTQENINSSLDDYKKNNLKPYNITINTNYYYMIRETGGIITGAYVDDRNSKIKANPYVKSNVGTEAYLLELGYISNKNDLNNIINNMDQYVDGIAISIKNLYDYNENM